MNTPKQGISKRVKKTVVVCLIGSAVIIAGIAGYIFRPDLAVAGKIIFKRNVIIKGFYKPTLNGSMSTSSAALLSQSNGGVDDYNNNGSMPTDTYFSSFTTCSSGNNWCGTGDSTNANVKDNSTGLVWSNYLGSGTAYNWFWANNCKYPNELPGDDGVCDTNAEIACRCVKLTSSKTGCEAFTGWRLPHQKELMQVYIDGSWGKLSSAGYRYWSATTQSDYTQYAWLTYLLNGYTYYGDKTGTIRVRCVR